MFRMLRRVSLAGGMLLLAVAGMAVHSSPAAAASKPSVYSHSWYIRDPGYPSYQTMYNLGASDGAFEKSCDFYVTVLDFGQVSYGNPYWGGGSAQYGTFIFNVTLGYPFMSDNQIAAAVEQYAAGWHHAASSCSSLQVAAGTSNNNECPFGSPCSTYTAGYDWGAMVNTVNSWLSAEGYSAQVDAAGADDVETGWDPPSKTFPFLNGFYASSGSHNTFLYDYGDAFVNSVWTDADVYDAAWGYYFDVPLPEIYTYYGANAWATLYHNHQNIVFFGVLTECASINSGYPGCSYPSGQYSPLNAWGAFAYQLGTSTPLESNASNIVCEGTGTPQCYV